MIGRPGTVTAVCENWVKELTGIKSLCYNNFVLQQTRNVRKNGKEDINMRKKFVVFAAVCVLGTSLLGGCRAAEESEGQTATVTTASEVAALDDPDAVKADASLEKPAFTVDLSGSVSVHMKEEASPLTAEAVVNDGGTVTYQWYKNKVNSNGGGTPIDGATDNSCVPDVTEEGIMYYYVVATNTLEKSVSKSTSSTIEVQVLPAGEWIQDASGWWYKYEDGSYPASCWKKIDGEWYSFDGNGYMRSGQWYQEGDSWYYLNPDGSMAHDTQIDGYTIDSDGKWVQ